METERSESAKAAAQIQYAIVILQQKFVEVIHSKLPSSQQRESLDFNKCLQVLKKNVGLIFGDDRSKNSVIKQLERARKIRNEYSHQNFDVAQFQHHVECLEKLAGLVGLERSLLHLPLPAKICDSEDWEILKAEGNKFYEDSKWTSAMDCYSRAIGMNSKVAVLYSNRALCEIQLEKWELAREDAEDAIELDPGQVKFYRTLTQALFSLSLLEETADACEKGLILDRTDVLLRSRLRDSLALRVDEQVRRHPVGGHINSMTTVAVGQLAKRCVHKESDVTAEDIEDIDFDEFWTSYMFCNKAHRSIHFETGNVLEREKKALKLFEAAAARRGYAEGMYHVGRMYQFGMAGLARDFERAYELYHKAAEQKPYITVFHGVIQKNIGVAEAETALGIYHRDGLQVEQNESLAFKWFLRAAEHGCSSGMNNLGSALSEGRGCRKNLESARSWFEKAADVGLSEAQSNLGHMLIDGRGGNADAARAAQLFKAAADQGLPGALNQLQKLMRSGLLGATKMAAAPKLVEERARENDKEALFLLGMNYLRGSGGYPKDPNRAEIHFRKAVELKHPQVDFVLGNLLLEEKKNEDAFKFIREAAEKAGEREAQHTLGMLLAYGHGCERDEKLARRWLLRSGKYAVSSEVDDILKSSAYVLQFEKSKKLKPDGLTFQERMMRPTKMLVSSTVGEDETKAGCIFERFQGFLHAIANPPEICSDAESPVLYIPAMLERATSGSKTALRFILAVQIYDNAVSALESGDHQMAFSLFRRAKRFWDVFPDTEATLVKAFGAANDAFERNPRDAEALFYILGFNSSKKGCDIQELVGIARTCVSLAPKVGEYHHRLSCMYAFAGDFCNSLRSCKRALELEYVPDWLYEKATALRLMEDQDQKVVIKAYKDFIEANEKDARKIPEAYYCIALMYLDMKKEDKAAEYRKKAQTAENPPVRLPCFGPIQATFPPKNTVETYFEVKGIAGPLALLKMPGRSASKQVKIVAALCANCGGAEAPSWCVRCRKVKYCHKLCQRQHWKDHKQDCSSA